MPLWLQAGGPGLIYIFQLGQQGRVKSVPTVLLCILLHTVYFWYDISGISLIFSYFSWGILP